MSLAETLAWTKKNRVHAEPAIREAHAAVGQPVKDSVVCEYTAQPGTLANEYFVDLVFGSNSQLRALAEVYAASLLHSFKLIARAGDQTVTETGTGFFLAYSAPRLQNGQFLSI